jgi:hypothetical protein
MMLAKIWLDHLIPMVASGPPLFYDWHLLRPQQPVF